MVLLSMDKATSAPNGGACVTRDSLMSSLAGSFRAQGPEEWNMRSEGRDRRSLPLWRRFSREIGWDLRHQESGTSAPWREARGGTGLPLGRELA